MIYGNKEKLSHFRQLINPNAADADLHLLAEKSPANSNLTKYAMRPAKNHNEILFDLLDICTHEEIVRNRRQFLKEDEAPKEKAPKEKDKKAKNPAKKQKKGKGSAAKKQKANAIEEEKAADKNDTAEDDSGKKGSDTESSGQNSSEAASSVVVGEEKKSG